MRLLIRGQARGYFRRSHAFKGTVSQEIGIALYRIVQESLANAVKHSDARRVKVRLWRNSRSLHLIVADLGRGFDAKTAFASNGLGLLSIRERVRMMSGELEIESTPDLGTKIHVCVPMNGYSRQLAAA
jgi:two-component system sensor histidine kinase DegS